MQPYSRYIPSQVFSDSILSPPMLPHVITSAPLPLPHIDQNCVFQEQSFFILVNFVANLQVLSLKDMKGTL